MFPHVSCLITDPLMGRSVIPGNIRVILIFYTITVCLREIGVFLCILTRSPCSFCLYLPNLIPQCWELTETGSFNLIVWRFQGAELSHDTNRHIYKVCRIKSFENFFRFWLSHFRLSFSFTERLCVCRWEGWVEWGRCVCVCTEMHVLSRKWWSHPLGESESQREWHRAFWDELSVGRVGRALWLCFVFVSRSLECSARCSCRSCSAMCFTGASAVWNSGRETRR